MTEQTQHSITRLGSLLEPHSSAATAPAAQTCPACGAEALQQKCKVVCRSEQCVYRIIYNCSEF